MIWVQFFVYSLKSLLNSIIFYCFAHGGFKGVINIKSSPNDLDLEYIKALHHQSISIYERNKYILYVNYHSPSAFQYCGTIFKLKSEQLLMSRTSRSTYLQI